MAKRETDHAADLSKRFPEGRKKELSTGAGILLELADEGIVEIGISGKTIGHR